MARRRVSRVLWSLHPNDPEGVPNARVALALLRCVQHAGTVFPEINWDDLGHALSPVAQHHPRGLKAALQAHGRDQIAAGDAPSFDPEASGTPVFDRDVAAALGEGIARGLPRFRGLVEKMEQSLEQFTARQAFAGDRSLDMLARLTGLNPLEVEVLRLAVACRQSAISRAIFGFINTGARVRRALECMFETTPASMARLFDPKGPLVQCALLELWAPLRNRAEMDELLGLSAVGEQLLGRSFDDEQSMARSILVPMAPPSEPPLAWPHLQAQHALIRCALLGALDRSERGINILLYGAPGTGKTEFVRQLVAGIDAHAFAVSDSDSDGDEPSRQDRLASLQLSQCLMQQAGRSVIVLDEAEDIFRSSRADRPLLKGSSEGKAWVNGLLERNAVPVVWISNSISHLDPAYLRRFTCCLEFPATPHALRRTIAQARLGELGCDDATIEFASTMPDVTPAHLDLAARFAGLGVPHGSSPNDAVRFVLESHLKAGGKPAPTAAPARNTRFDLRYLNIGGNVAPQALLHSLERRASASGPDGPEASPGGMAMLFAGAPGTGKTALAAEVARRLGLRLVVRTASDINSKWYGESEANVARMFRDCDPTTELLFLDEAEILLASREDGSHRADRAVTAEFLRWLEQFEGIFVCATNHAASFDAALIRRFTFRLEFQPLLLRQRIELFAEVALGWCPEAGEAAPEVQAGTRRHLERLDALTPGDFANAARRIRALALPDDAWLDELEAEQRAKNGGSGRQIGFV